MKKIVTLVVAVLVCLTAAFAGCNGSTGYSNGLNINKDDKVSSNGGFAVQKGEYVYFINGVATHEADNTYGDVVTGALVRIKASELKGLDKTTLESKVVKDDKGVDKDKTIANIKEANKKNAEMVIPSLMVAGDKEAGFYMFGDKIYYASPVNTKNKEGKVENTKLNFISTTLDGTTSTIIKTVEDNTTKYRFTNVNDTVYLVLDTVNDKKEKVISIINTKDNKETVSNKVENVIFGEGDNFTEVYYTKLSYDENLEKDEEYNEVHRINVADQKDQLLLVGKDMMKDGENAENNGFGLKGAKFSLVKDTKDYLFLKAEYVDNSIITVTNYYVAKKADLKADNEETKDVDEAKENFGKLKVVNNGTASASSVYASNSLYIGSDVVIYLDKTYGVLRYKAGDTTEGAVEGRTRVFFDKDFSQYTAKFWNNGYLYATDENSNYYRVNVGAVVNMENGELIANAEKPAVERVNFFATATDWYMPEIITVDGKDYMLSVYTNDPYASLVYADDITANKTFEDEDIKKLTQSKKVTVEFVLSNSVSIWSKDKADVLKDYMEKTFKNEK